VEAPVREQPFGDPVARVTVAAREDGTPAADLVGGVAGEDGTVELSESAGTVVKRAGTHAGRVPAHWRERFGPAFDAELQAWVDAVAAGGTTGPSAWDGYAATVVCETGLAALRSGARDSVFGFSRSYGIFIENAAREPVNVNNRVIEY